MRHTRGDLLAQRIYGLACGHPDANDAARLADDPIHTLLLGRDPVVGDPLASQPTISRFENRVGRHALYAMGRELAASVIDRHRQRLHGRARRITIELDPTDDPTHGAQQPTFFNGHYDCWCCLPLLAFLTSTTKPSSTCVRRSSVRAMRRRRARDRDAVPPARRPASRVSAGPLPGAAGWRVATPELFDFLDAEPGLD